MMRRLAIACAIAPLSLGALASPTHAAQLCAADLNGNGDAADAGEMAQCLTTADGSPLCPIGKVDCVADSSGAYGCPLGAAYACLTPAGGAVPAAPAKNISGATMNISGAPVAALVQSRRMNVASLA